MAREEISPANKRLWKTIVDEKRARIGIGSRFDTRFEVLTVAFLELPRVRTWHGVVAAQLLDGGGDDDDDDDDDNWKDGLIRIVTMAMFAARSSWV
jgi:hypothetical protein